jgi:ketosteroid isomerase-like protein
VSLSPRARVEAYYADLRTGDAARVARHFTEDAVHYYTRRDPDRGAEAIARNAALAVGHLHAEWRLEHVVASEDEAAIEWSLAFDDPRAIADPATHPQRRLLDRGAELFVFRDGLIAEVRAYYGDRGGDLRGFDHAGRGHAVLP